MPLHFDTEFPHAGILLESLKYWDSIVKRFCAVIRIVFKNLQRLVQTLSMRYKVITLNLTLALDLEIPMIHLSVILTLPDTLFVYS